MRTCKACYAQTNAAIESEKNSIVDILASEDARFLNGYVPIQRIDDSLPLKKVLKEKSANHFHAVLDRIFEDHPALNAEWRETISRLSMQIASAVVTNVRSEDDVGDINSLVDILLVPGGSIADIELIQGVVVSKSLAQKTLRKKQFPQNPRMLLIEECLDLVSFSEPRLSVIRDLIEQEQNMLDLLVERIKSFSPDIVIVGSYVSLLILKRLIALGVAVLQGVDRETLLKLAQLTGAPLLKNSSHIKHVAKLGTDVIAVAKNIRVTTITDDPEVL